MEKKTHTIVFSGRTVHYRLLRNHRGRSIQLSVRPDGVLVVSVPKRIVFKDVESVLYQHRRWILNRLEKKRMFPEPFYLKNGAKLPLLDSFYHLTIIVHEKKYGSWESGDSTLTISVPELSMDWKKLCVKSWYREQAKSYLHQRILFWSAKMQVQYNRFYVKDQRSIWGSCSKRLNVNFNWRIMLLTLQEADYLIIHELAHLKVMNHSPQFWKNVEKYCPDYRILKKRIKDKNHLLQFL